MIFPVPHGRFIMKTVLSVLSDGASFLQVITNFPETSDIEENVEVARQGKRG